MSDGVEEITFSISAEDGGSDEVTVPAGIVDLVAEEGQDPAQTVGDVLLLSFASRAHQIVHHEDEDLDIEDEEARVMGLFEERFGVSYAEATGHQH